MIETKRELAEWLIKQAKWSIQHYWNCLVDKGQAVAVNELLQDFIDIGIEAKKGK